MLVLLLILVWIESTNTNELKSYMYEYLNNMRNILLLGAGIMVGENVIQLLNSFSTGLDISSGIRSDLCFSDNKINVTGKGTENYYKY